MRKRKSILALLMSMIMIASLCGCSKDKKEEKDTAEISTESTSTSNDASTEDDSSEPTTEYVPEEDPSSPEALEEQKKFDDWLWESFAESVTSDTITLHYTLAHPEEYGITPPEVTYGDVDFSDEAIAEDKKELQESIGEMEAFDYELLTIDQRFTYDILYESAQVDLDFYDYIYLYEPFAYTSGLHSNLPITLSEYTFYDLGDVDDYLKLLELAPAYFQAYLDFEQVKSDKGLFMSESCAEEVIRQCKEYIQTPEENLLIETFNDRIGEVEGITEEQIEEYKQANHDAVINYIIPTYENVITTFKRLKTTGENDLGLCNLDGGKEYYKYLIASKVGTDKTPEDIITLLDEELNTTMNDLYTVVYTNYAGYESYFNDIDDLYAKDFDEKETIQFFEEAFESRFPDIPPINFTVTPVHESLEGIVSPAFFMTPPMDDYENNSIYINNGSESTGSLWSTLAHEGVPGHMYQFVYFLSNDPEPIRTILSFNGYQEGWATYVEMMAYEYYDGFADPIYADIEKINGKLNLLVSARVEIGVNYEGWTLEETEEYLAAQGFDPSVAQDIYEYVVAEPANYQMYCTGWLEFEKLRDYSEEALGDKFKEVDFHKVLLDAGPCQFFLLKNKVDQYINQTK